MIEHRYHLAGSGRLDAFRLYAAICRALPCAHGAGWAIAARDGREFVIRGPDSAPQITRLDLDGDGSVTLVGSTTIAPAPALSSRIVVIRLTRPPPLGDPEFRARVVAHITDRAEILGADHVEVSPDPQHVRVHGRAVRGYGVRVTTSDPKASLRVLELGIGGKRSMGCGVFFAEPTP